MIKKSWSIPTIFATVGALIAGYVVLATLPDPKRYIPVSRM
ncbi:MAG: hypothetical protein ACRD3B_03925 [Candidatus Sulfotelmatobacter sp.]